MLRTVAVHRLDTLIGVARPLMIKVDVEGFEGSVVRGALGMLARDCVKAIELETLTAEIQASLGRLSFRRAYYDPFRRSLTAAPSGPPASNAVFIRDWDFVAGRLGNAPAIDVLGRSI